MTSYTFCAVFFILSVYLFSKIVWMKITAKYSKPRFAFFTLGAMFSVFCLTLGAIISFDWVEFGYQLLKVLGIVTSDTPLDFGWPVKLGEKSLVLLLGLFAIYLIGLFAYRALLAWDGPMTMAAFNLQEKGHPNNLLALAAAEFETVVQKKSDPVVDSRITNWKQNVALAPNAVQFKELVKVAFQHHLSEALIDDEGWRQHSEAWVGYMFGPAVGAQTDIIVLVLSDLPTDDQILTKIEHLKPKNGSKIFGVVENALFSQPQIMRVGDREVELWGYQSLIRSGLPLQSYARQLIRQFEQVTVGGTEATLAQTFVPAKVRVEGRGVRLLSDLIREWALEPGRRHLAITGEYGQGKSTAMLELCVKWAKDFLEGRSSHARIPLLVELRGKSPGEMSPTEFLAQWGSRYGFHAERLYSLIRSGQALLIFEGFDELRNAGREYERHEHFNALWRLAYPGTKIIFTGRPNFFIDQFERNSTLRIDDNGGAASNAFTIVASVCMFDENEVKFACRAYEPDVRDGIAKTFHSHSDFREIVARPSMLPVVATIWPEIQAAEDAGEGITGSMLLERYLSATYTRKEAEIEREKVFGEAPELASYLLLPRALREALTLSIVWEMAAADLRNTIPRAHFDSVISRVFDNVLRALQSSDVRSPTLEEAKRLAVRMGSESRAQFIEKVCTDVASAGLFVPDPVGGPSSLRFAHKQYYEYLIAKFAWMRLAMPQNEVVQSILPDKAPFNSGILQLSEAILPFNRILGSNFSCFSKYYFRVRFVSILSAMAQVVGIFVAERVISVLQDFLQKSKAIDDKPNVNNNVMRKRFKARGFSAVITNSYAFTAFFFGIAFTFASFFLVFRSTFVESGDEFISLGRITTFFFFTVVIPASGIWALRMARTGIAGFYLDVCDNRVDEEIAKQEVFPSFRAFLILQLRERLKNLKYIKYPLTKISIAEVVTGVPISEQITGSLAPKLELSRD